MTRNGGVIAELKNGDNVVDMYQSQRDLLSREEYTQINNNLELVLEMMYGRNAKHDETQNVIKLQEDVYSFFSSQEAERDLEIVADEEQFDFSV